MVAKDAERFIKGLPLKNWRTAESLIRGASVETQQNLNAIFADGEPEEGSSLDQAGLREGLHTIEEYLAHGEYGLALDHLVYMICEPPVRITEAMREDVLEAAKLLEMTDEVRAKLGL